MIACCVCLASCMGTKEISIYTEPDGATIYINGVPQKGATPMTVEVKQEKDLGIVACKPGYETAACTLRTQSKWWLALLWTKDDPRARFIEEDEVMLKLNKIPSPEGYRPGTLPPYTGGGGATTPTTTPKPPALRPMPADIVS